MKTIAIGCLALVLSTVDASADDPTPAEPKGNFMSSLKQSFQHDYDHEVVRGHFDIGTPPDTHRYYCLTDPKTGKLEANGVAGTPQKRHDGTTAVQGAAVSFYSCADAESKGLLVTSEYKVPEMPARPAAAKQAKPPAGPVTTTSAAPAAPTLSAEPAPLKVNTTDPMAALTSFLDIYNAGGGIALEGILGESADFAWVQPDGRTVWGHRAAAEVLRTSHAAGSQLQFQSQEGHTLTPASKTAVLITRLRLTGNNQDMHLIRCSSVLVQTSKGWRISSLFMTPEAG